MDILRTVVDTAQRRAKQAVSDLRLGLLQTLLQFQIASLEADTRAALGAARARPIDEVAMELGRRHWEKWRAALRLAVLAMEDDAEISASGMLEMAAAGWKTLAEQADTLYPYLGRDARVRLRASAFGLARLVRLRDDGMPPERALRDLPDLLPAEADDDASSFFALLELLCVGGQTGGNSDVLDACARRLWSITRGEVERILGPDAVENSFWSAEAAESIIDDEPAMPLAQCLSGGGGGE